MNITMIEPAGLSRVAVYNPIEAGIALLLEKHGHVLTTPPDVSNAKALALTRSNKQELVKFRTRIEAARKQEQAESLAYGRLVDSEAARITAIAAPLEAAYEAAITAEEDRIAEIERAKVEAERVRVEDITRRIEMIRAFVVLALECRTASAVAVLIEKVSNYPMQDMDEFEQEAITVRAQVLSRLGDIHAAKLAEESERARIKANQEAQAARLEEERADLDRKRALFMAELADAAKAKREADAQRAAWAAEIEQRNSEARALVIDPDEDAGHALMAGKVVDGDPTPLLPSAPNAPELTDYEIRAACLQLMYDEYGMECDEALARLATIEWITEPATA